MNCCEAMQAGADAFEWDPTDRTWNIKGCCGGYCYVAEAVVFCPWCGERLEPADPSSD